MIGLTGKRVVGLYRVSTKQQMGEEEDMPTQKKIVQKFIFENEMILVMEFVEGGISGYKKTADEREALVTIKEMAKNKEFDILAIYHSNRFGRRMDMAHLVKELYVYGVRLFSILEGELKTETPTDVLMNSVRFFNNEQESYLKSEVISDYHISAVEQGRFRGGSMIPYGYKLEDNGSKNYKSKHILDFVINDEEAVVIKTIFDLSINLNYGQSRIAKYLNEHNVKTKKGGAWFSSTIQYIMNNPIYKGQFHINSRVRNKTVVSQIQDRLIIIPEEMWKTNQEKMQNRIYTKTYDNVEDKRTSKNTYGKMLLNGLAFCGDCGLGLTTMTSYTAWTTADGEKHKKAYYRYRCGSFYRHGGVACKGQSTYGITKIEPTVIEGAKAFVLRLEGRKLQENFVHSMDEEVKKLVKEKTNSREELEKSYKKLNALGEELAKILIGESDMSKDLVSGLVKKTEELILRLNNRIYSIDKETAQKKDERENFVSLGSEFADWGKKFDDVDLVNKRAMLTKIIDRIDIYKDEISIKFSDKVETFMKNSYTVDSN